MYWVGFTEFAYSILQILTSVCKTIIRPKLEYCVQLWNPAAFLGNWSIILELESIHLFVLYKYIISGTLEFMKKFCLKLRGTIA